jgi:hypothetical protein
MADRVALSMPSPRVRSVVAVAAVTLVSVGCAAGARQRVAAPISVPATSERSAASSATSSPGAQLTPTPMTSGSGTDPAASNLSAPPAASVPTVTMFDAEHGVAVVGVSPLASGNARSTLWISTDLTHWRDVTPPGARDFAWERLYATFDEASFLDASTGWVTSWNVGNLAVTAYRTTDGGKTWSAIGIGGHGDHGGDAEWIQLLNPTTAFAETIAATAARMNVAVTSDAGQSWRTTYTGPPWPSADTDPSPGPFELPMSFISATRGFAATAIPPAEPQVPGGFFSTSDGGAHWTQLTPPGPDTAACTGSPTTGSQCWFALPTFADPTHGVLASEVITGTQASIGFDTSSDAGATWRRAATIHLPLPPVAAGSYPKPYALVATPTTSNWWTVSATGNGLTSQVTTDAGKHWSTVQTAGLLGAPSSLQAADASHALLETSTATSERTTSALYATTDSGRIWHPIF